MDTSGSYFNWVSVVLFEWICYHQMLAWVGYSVGHTCLAFVVFQITRLYMVRYPMYACIKQLMKNQNY